MLAVRGERHRLLPAGDDDPRIAAGDLLQPQGDRPKARAAQLIDTPGGALDRNSGIDRGLPCRILPLTGGQDLPHDDFVDLPGLDLGALDRRLDGNRPQIMGRHARKGAVEGANRRSRCGNNHYRIL